MKLLIVSSFLLLATAALSPISNSQGCYPTKDQPSPLCPVRVGNTGGQVNTGGCYPTKDQPSPLCPNRI